jgi:hypothetical protein
MVGGQTEDELFNAAERQRLARQEEQKTEADFVRERDAIVQIIESVKRSHEIKLQEMQNRLDEANQKLDSFRSKK